MGLLLLWFFFQHLPSVTQQTVSLTGQQLNRLNLQQVRQKSEDIAHQLSLKLNDVHSQLVLMQAYAQQLIDSPKVATAQMLPVFDYDPHYRWSLSAKDADNVAINLRAESLTSEGQLSEQTLTYLRQMLPLKSFLGLIAQHGVETPLVWTTGPKHNPIQFTYPWLNLNALFEQKYPGQNSEAWWDYFFPGAIDSWTSWTQRADFQQMSAHQQITWTPMYEDGAGNGLMVTFCAPLWNRTRSASEGMIAIDFSAHQLISLLKEQNIGRSGFAFLVDSQGETLGLSATNLVQLGLTAQVEQKEAFEKTSFNLKQSQLNSVQQLAQTVAQTRAYVTNSLLIDQTKRLRFSLMPLAEYPFWYAEDFHVKPNRLFVVVMMDEAELNESEQALSDQLRQLSEQTFVSLFVLLLIITSLVVLLATLFAIRDTRQIRHLTTQLKQFGSQHQSFHSTDTPDQLDGLSYAFARMSETIASTYQQLQQHAEALDKQVILKTDELAFSNQQLQQTTEKIHYLMAQNKQVMTELVQQAQSPIAAIEAASQRLHQQASPLSVQDINLAIDQMTQSVTTLIRLIETLSHENQRQNR